MSDDTKKMSDEAQSKKQLEDLRIVRNELFMFNDQLKDHNEAYRAFVWLLTEAYANAHKQEFIPSKDILIGIGVINHAIYDMSKYTQDSIDALRDDIAIYHTME